MKRERRLVDQRQNQIYQQIRERGEMSVEELAAGFEVSTMTVRRDLQELEEKGKILRYYGGASAIVDTKPLGKEEEIRLCRRRIAEYAAKFLEPDDTIFINGSSTALEILDHIGDRSVMVITNNGGCMRYPSSDTLRILVTGGRILKGTQIMVGDVAVHLLDKTRADKAFLGFTGISDDGEVICNIPAEMRINELMLQNCKDYYILVDHTKMGKISNFASTVLDRPGTVITDDLANDAVCDRLRHYGMTIHQVPTRLKSHK